MTRLCIWCCIISSASSTWAVAGHLLLCALHRASGLVAWSSVRLMPLVNKLTWDSSIASCPLWTRRWRSSVAALVYCSSSDLRSVSLLSSGEGDVGVLPMMHASCLLADALVYLDLSLKMVRPQIPMSCGLWERATAATAVARPQLVAACVSGRLPKDSNVISFLGGLLYHW